MTLRGDDYDPPPGYVVGTSDWVRFEQAELYARTNGKEGGTIYGAPIVTMTILGRRTGVPRRVAVMRVEHDGRYAVVASLGGMPHNPAWYHNLIANPVVLLQDGPDVRPYRATVVEGPVRAAWWERAVAAFPRYADYQARTERVIPVFELIETRLDPDEAARFSE